MAQWETLSKKDDGWEDLDGWETIEPKKRNTTFGEDIGIGWGNAASTAVKGLGLIGGGVTAQFDQDTADSIFKGTDELAKSVKDYWTPQDAEQGFGGKVASMVGSLPGQLLAMPFSPADTGTEMLNAGETLPKAVTGTALDTAGNIAGVAIPGGFGKGLLSKFVTGAASNTAQDTAVRLGIQGIADTEKIKKDFAPTAETAGLAAVLGGPMGMMTPNARPDVQPQPKPEVKLNTTNPAIETGLMTAGLEAARKDLAMQTQVLQDIQERIAQGDSSKETIRALEEVEAIVKHHTDEVKAFEDVLGGKTDAVSAKAAAAINQRQQQLDSFRDHRGHEAGPDEYVPFPDSIPEGWKDGVDPETGEILREQPPELAATKQSPHEIALERIGEAMDNPVLAAKRLQEAQDRLAIIEQRQGTADTPGSNFSAIRAALEFEIKAFSDIVEGQKPNLKQETALVPKEESIFRTPDEAFQAGVEHRGENISQIDALRKTEAETREILKELQALIEKPKKTLEEDLRIAELNDKYNEIATRNNPRDELVDTIQGLQDEKSDLLKFYSDDPYTKLRVHAIDAQLAKYAEFQRRAEAQVRGDTPRINVEAPRIAEQTPSLPEIPAHILEQDAALRSLDHRAEPKQAGPLERLPDEAYANDPYAGKPVYDTPVRPEGATRSPEGQYKWLNNQLNNVQRRLETVNESLRNPNVAHQGAMDQDAHQGMTREQELLAQKDKLEWQQEQLERQLEQIKKSTPDVLDKIRAANDKAADALPTLLADFVQPNKFGDVDALLNSTRENGVWTEQTMRDLDDNPQLFDKHGANIYFDKRIAAPIQAVLKNLLKLTKFLDEKVYFVYDQALPGGGRQKHFGNSTVIALNPEKLRFNLDMNRNMTGFQKFMGTGPVDNALKIFHATRYLTHEIGHALLNKYLRDTVVHKDNLLALSKQFDDYVKQHGFKVNSVFDIFNQKERLQYQDTFHEFFAERVASQLMHKHLLSSFGLDSPYIKSIGQLIKNSVDYLKGQKIDLDEKNFADSILNDILNDSKETIAATSERARYDITQLHNDKYILESQRVDPESFPFYKKTMEEARLVLNEIPGMVRGGKGFDDMAQPVVGTGVIARLAHGLGRNLFGKLGASRIYFDDPLIKETHDKIRDAEIKADEINNKLWFGEIQRGDWDKRGFVARMSKIKLETSAYFQVKNAKPADLNTIHDVFKKGFEQGLDYLDNKTTNGAHLTPSQAKLYDTLSKLFKEQFLEVQKLETDLNKKNLISERKGWYPAVRQGQYFVDISFNGRTLHREQFRSKVEADQFRTKMQQSGAKNVVVSDAQHIKDNQQVSDMYGGLELAQRILEQKFPAAQGPIRQTIQQALERVIERGGKLGSHHKFRSNLSGYRGSELFYNIEDRGNSFAKAIQQSVNDYSGGLRKMMIQHTVDPTLKASGLDPNAPNVQTAQMMRDSALNRVVPNAMEKIDRSIINAWDSIMKAAFKELSPNQKGSFEEFHGKILEFFYLTKLMSKTVFPIGQLLTVAGAIREMSVEGGYIRPYISMAKGIAKIATGNKELNNILFDVSQKSNTFEPQFIEALHLGGQDGKTMEFLKDYVLLRKLNEAADSFSRLTVFASAFEMYKDLGLSVEDAKRKAMDDTNTTMVPYGRTEAAPIFNRMGIIGNAMKPLQTFGQQQLANWIHDFRYMKANDVKTWAPMLNYMLMATALYGAMSPQFIQEYETIRAMMEKFWPEHAPMPMIEIAKHTPDFLDRVFEDETMVQKAMMYGIPAAALGVDVASSNRSNLTFLSLIGAVITGQEDATQLIPHLNAVAGTVSGLATGVKAAVGGDVTDAQKRTAIQQVMPTGAFNYGTQDAFNVNKANIMGKPTGMTAGGKANEAQVPLTEKERIAGYMGTKSTHERFRSDIQRAQVSEERSRKAQVDKLYTLLIETPPEKEAARKVFTDKLVKLGQTPDSIVNRIQKEAWDRKIPALTRSVVGQGGTVKETPDNLRKIQELRKYGPFDKAQP